MEISRGFPLAANPTQEIAGLDLRELKLTIGNPKRWIFHCSVNGFLQVPKGGLVAYNHPIDRKKTAGIPGIVIAF